MKELIHQTWLTIGFDEDSYKSWGEDDEGRMKLICEQCVLITEMNFELLANKTLTLTVNVNKIT